MTTPSDTNGKPQNKADAAEKRFLKLQKSAKSRNIDFSLTIDNVRKLLKETHCQYTGVPFTPSGDNTATVERIDNNKGYIPGNVIPVTRRVNGLKSNHSDEKLYGFVRFKLPLDQRINEKYKEIDAIQRKIENRKKLIAELLANNTKDEANVIKFLADISETESRRDLNQTLYKSIADSLPDAPRKARKYMTLWQKLTMVSEFVRKFF